MRLARNSPAAVAPGPFGLGLAPAPSSAEARAVYDSEAWVSIKDLLFFNEAGTGPGDAVISDPSGSVRGFADHTGAGDAHVDTSLFYADLRSGRFR